MLPVDKGAHRRRVARPSEGSPGRGRSKKVATSPRGSDRCPQGQRGALLRLQSEGFRLTARLIDDVRKQRLSEAPERTGDKKLRFTPSQRLSQARPLLEQLESTLRGAGIESDVLEELKKLLEG